VATSTRSYGHAVCPTCGELFERRSGNATCCSLTCAREHRQRGQRKRRQRRRELGPVEDALRDLSVTIVYDDRRLIRFPQAELRWAAVVDCLANQRDPGARAALRQTWLDLAAICVRLAAELPPPALEPRFDPDQRQRFAAYAAAMNGAG
jgi:hypothetical protein